MLGIRFVNSRNDDVIIRKRARRFPVLCRYPGGFLFIYFFFLDVRVRFTFARKAVSVACFAFSMKFIVFVFDFNTTSPR